MKEKVKDIENLFFFLGVTILRKKKSVYFATIIFLVNFSLRPASEGGGHRMNQTAHHHWEKTACLFIYMKKN